MGYEEDLLIMSRFPPRWSCVAWAEEITVWQLTPEDVNTSDDRIYCCIHLSLIHPLILPMKTILAPLGLRLCLMLTR